MLRNKADRRTLLFIASYFVLFGFQWIAAPSTLFIAVPLIIATCWLSWICAVITHNTVHCPMFVSKPLNRFFQIVLTLTYGHPVSSYVSGHNLSHHRHTQQPKDVMRTSKMRYKSNLLNMLLFFPTVGGAITKGDIVFAKTMRKRRPTWFRQFVLEAVVFVGVSVTLVVLDWQKFLLYWFLPHTYAAWGIISMNYLQHDGCDEEHEYNHSRNFVSRFFNWWVFNNGFHGIHHMKPSLHWSELRKAHDELVKPHQHPALDEPSILKYLFRAFIWPGKRLRFNGEPVVLPPKHDDVSWIPSFDVEERKADLGAA